LGVTPIRLSYTEQTEHIVRERSRTMIMLDPPTLLAIAAVLGSLASLVWAARRRR